MKHRMTHFAPVLIMLSIMASFSACNNRRAVAKYPKPALYSNGYSPYSDRCDSNKRLKTGSVYLVTHKDTVFPCGTSIVLNEDGTCWMNSGRSGIYQIAGDSLFMQIYYVLSGYETSSIFQYWDIDMIRCEIIDSVSFRFSHISRSNDNSLKPSLMKNYDYESSDVIFRYYPLKNPLYLHQPADILNQKWIWKDKKEWKAWKKAQKAKKKKRKKESPE